MNLANTPGIYLDQEYSDYFFSLSLHELSHYVYCPFDTATNFRLLAAAIQGGINKFYAPMVVNIFSDLVIDWRNHQQFPEIMNWELKKTVEEILIETPAEKHSNLWKLLVSCYEHFWDQQVLPDGLISEELDKLAGRICANILKDYEDENLWEPKVKKIARQLKKLLKESCSMKSESSFSSRQQVPGATNPFDLPQDVIDTFGDLTDVITPDAFRQKTPDLSENGKGTPTEQIQSTAEGLASEMDFQTFRDVLTLHGAVDPIENLALWYRGQVKDLLRIEIFESKPQGSIPMYPDVWKIGDPLEQLDPIQTLLTSPVIIPNVTTRKWVYIEGPGIQEEKELPDLMVVLDSSGSMGWNFRKKSISGQYHIALLAAFAAVQYVLQRGSLVSVINFSDRIRTQPWTSDVRKIEKKLLDYQGFGTTLPTKKMEQMAKSSDRPALILLISDLELDNWVPALQTYTRLLQQKHHVISFFIDGDESFLETEEIQELRTLGARFYCVDKVEDLVGMVISEVDRVYSPNIPSEN
jgi:hypothetical protein